MAIDDQVHGNRARAESFGAVAADYDRYRPGYPQQLIADLVALRPARVLDIGCGTGKATRLLAASGPAVLGVEIDPKMAEVARGHGLEVEVASFEDWDDRGRTFDLITSAQAWHWVEPVAGAAKAARVLTPGGHLAPFWNFSEVDDTTRAVLDDVYGRLAPELAHLHSTQASRPHQRSYAADLRTGGHFADVRERTYTWSRRKPVADWVGEISTQSDHLLLGPQRLPELLHEIDALLRDVGPEVMTSGGTYLILARRGN